MDELKNGTSDVGVGKLGQLSHYDRDQVLAWSIANEMIDMEPARVISIYADAGRCTARVVYGRVCRGEILSRDDLAAMATAAGNMRILSRQLESWAADAEINIHGIMHRRGFCDTAALCPECDPQSNTGGSDAATN